jgi:hypothetical protein
MSAPMVWISNFNLESGTAGVKAKESMDAIISRAGGKQLWFAADDAKLFQYTIWLATAGKLFAGCDIPLKARTYAINWFIEHRNRLGDVSPRALFHLARDLGRVGLNSADRPHLESLRLKDAPVRNIPGFGRLHLDLNKDRWVEEEPEESGNKKNIASTPGVEQSPRGRRQRTQLPSYETAPRLRQKRRRSDSGAPINKRLLIEARKIVRETKKHRLSQHPYRWGFHWDETVIQNNDGADRVREVLNMIGRADEYERLLEKAWRDS